MSRPTNNSRVRRSAQAGFSLTETLVVAGISAAMMAALIPMVSATVATSRSLTCKNNLHRLSEALHAYHDVHGNFPSGFEYAQGTEGYVSNASAAYPNWIVRLLPLIDEQALFDSIDFSQRMTASLQDYSVNVNKSVTETDLTKLWCPEDSGHDRKYARFLGFKSVNGKFQRFFQYYARGNYAANACLAPPIVFGTTAHTTSECGGPNTTEWRGVYGLPLRGIMGGNVSVPRPQIVDGMSNTILLSEVNVGLADVDFRGSWALGYPAATTLWWHYIYGPNGIDDLNGDDCSDSNELYAILGGGNTAAAINAGRSIARSKNMGCGVEDGWMSGGNPKSRHDGGIFVAMADGSVKFIKNEVDRQPHGGYWMGQNPDPQYGSGVGVWERLNMSADGMVVNTDSETVIPFVLGDMNGDGYVNNLDIGPFDLALTKPVKYQEQFPALTDYQRRGDCNLDGEFNNLDIQPFEELLAGNR